MGRTGDRSAELAAYAQQAKAQRNEWITVGTYASKSSASNLVSFVNHGQSHWGPRHSGFYEGRVRRHPVPVISFTNGVGKQTWKWDAQVRYVGRDGTPVTDCECWKTPRKAKWHR